MTTAFAARPKISTLSRREILEKYPEIPKFIVLKIDMQLRSIVYTDRALATVDPKKHQTQVNSWTIDRTKFGDVVFPVSLLLRDGSIVMAGPHPKANNPYVVDYRDGRTVLLDEGEEIEEVEFWPSHDFFDKYTSSGKPMWEVVGFCRPQRLDVNPNYYCHFWDHGQGCRFCNIGSTYKNITKQTHRETRLSLQDLDEVIREALKQPGRYTNICLTGGSIPGLKNAFEEEVRMYIDVLQTIGSHFSTRRFPSQLISSAFNEEQLGRIYENTGLLSFTADTEVLNEEKFNWICPGKATSVGYREWRRRLIAAVDIFGRGCVNTGFVTGVELAAPKGFATEEDGLAATLDGAEELASQGVFAVAVTWQPCEGSVFHNQKPASLEYHIRLAKELDAIRRKYGLYPDMDDYRRCGNHADTDLGRI
jgi:hypothetical protein